MNIDQILLIALVITFGILIVYVLYAFFNNLSINKREKKIEKTYKSENLKEVDFFTKLNDAENEISTNTDETKTNKFFE